MSDLSKFVYDVLKENEEKEYLENETMRLGRDLYEFKIKLKHINAELIKCNDALAKIQEIINSKTSSKIKKIKDLDIWDQI
jgi:hypothetical protein